MAGELLRRLRDRPQLTRTHESYQYRSKSTGRLRTGTRISREWLAVYIPSLDQGTRVRQVRADADTDELPARLEVVSSTPGLDSLPPYVWLFRGSLYASDREMDAMEVKALILRDDLRARAKIAAAMALMEQEKELSEHGRREPIPEDVKIFVWRRDGGVCVKCGATTGLEYDHVIPLAMGGSNGAKNLQLLCGACNRTKGANLV